MTQPTMLQTSITPDDMEMFLDDIETMNEKLERLYKARHKQEPAEEQAAIADLLKTWNCLKGLY
ncbi:hypothetical protein AB3R30_15060 [Leptolyngbyaceae cyanobacterium UHCC 1019]